MKRFSLMSLLFIFPGVAIVQADINTGVYTSAQASVGQVVYNRECTICHGPALEGTEGGIALTGNAFMDNWQGRSLAEFIMLTRQTMPVTKPNGLTDTEYANVVAYILNRNAYASGEEILLIDSDQLSEITFSAPENMVIEEVAASHPAEGAMVEWLHHRGDAGSKNYSELDLINSDNAENLEVAWRWRSDNFGPVSWPNLQTTPLMANGVLYATAGYRRAAVALDAASGETLWMYRIDEGERGDAMVNNNRFGLVLILAGECARAQQWYEKAAAETTNNALFLFELSRLASRRGDYPAALNYLSSVESKISNQSRYQLAYGYKLARSSADAIRVIGDEDLPNINQGRVIQAIVYLSVDQNSQALKELELAVNNPTIAVMETAFIKTNAFADPVLDQPGFVAVRERLGYGKLARVRPRSIV